MKMDFKYKNIFCLFVLVLSGLTVQSDLLCMSSNFDLQEAVSGSAPVRNKLKRKRQLNQKEPHQGDKENDTSLKRQCLSLDSTIEIENVSESSIPKKSFKFHLFKAQQCPALLKQVVDQVQDKHEDAEILTTQWQYSGGYYFFKAYHQNLLGSPIPFLQGKKSPDFMLKTFHKSCILHSDKSDFLESLFNAQLEKAAFEKEANEDVQTACKRMLATHYKIHLMPQSGQLQNVIERIVREFINNQELRSLVSEFKVCKKLLELSTDQDFTDEQVLAALEQDAHYMPAIVIYPQDGKEHAQRVLDIITTLFNGVQGLDVAPRFNQKVTSLIYYAQGNGDDKICDHLKIYYEDDCIHFTAEFTGKRADYRLIFDQAQNELDVFPASPLSLLLLQRSDTEPFDFDL